mmetsp:Transcript_9941/g.27685  ORF Transcript_9941/g.27685 Transcript_9941/m.27685 type:complete len:424 (+) Transcript_9941:277-1548(+)
MSPPAVYILRICGSDAPTKYSDGTYIESDAKHFSVPVKGFALGWSTPVPFFEQLDLMDKVKLANPQYMHSPCMHDAIKAGTIKSEVGADAFSSAAPAQTDVELVLSSSPYVNWQNVTKRSGGCYCDKDVFFDGPADDTPLGRAEWIKFIATFFNEEDRANLIFSREKAAYDATKALAASAAAAHGSTKKKCAWIKPAGGSGSFSMTLKADAYKVAYCEDAGMTAVVPADGTNSQAFTDAAAWKTFAADIDVFIDESGEHYGPDSYDTKAEVFAFMGPGWGESDLKAGALLLRIDRELSDNSATSTKFYETNEGTSGYNYAWLESAVFRPAHALQGLVHEVWPDYVKAIPDTCVDYFRDIIAEEAHVIKDHTHCTKWDNANAESKCVTNILSDDEYAAIRSSPAAKPAFIVAILVALVVAFIGA